MRTVDEIREQNNLLVLRVSDDGGMGEIEYGKLRGSIIWSFGGGWEHVSVAPYKSSYTPSWAEMCRIKDMFWREDEVVVQFHPAREQYVNNVSNCLHLWRPIEQEIPTPPSIFVGIRDNQSFADAAREARRWIE